MELEEPHSGRVGWREPPVEDVVEGLAGGGREACDLGEGDAGGADGAEDSWPVGLDWVWEDGSGLELPWAD